jgi:hypothetical protein
MSVVCKEDHKSAQLNAIDMLRWNGLRQTHSDLRDLELRLGIVCRGSLESSLLCPDPLPDADVINIWRSSKQVDHRDVDRRAANWRRAGASCGTVARRGEGRTWRRQWMSVEENKSDGFHCLPET